MDEFVTNSGYSADIRWKDHGVSSLDQSDLRGNEYTLILSSNSHSTAAQTRVELDF